MLPREACKTIVLAAGRQAGGALKFAQYSLKTPQRTLLADRDVVLAAVEQSAAEVAGHQIFSNEFSGNHEQITISHNFSLIFTQM